MSGISLTASMRSNLLSLQNISGQVSSTQNKLSTGNKVNSAIDNPSSYYTALSLNNRADDLNALLDSMGQAVSTIKAATTALESATEFLEQAKAVANQALETAKVPDKAFFEEKVGENGAVVTTAQELRDAVAAGKETICVYGAIDLGDISTSGGLDLKENQKLVGVGYFGNYDTDTNKFSSISATANANEKNLIDITQNGCFISDLRLNYNNTFAGIYMFAIKVSGDKNKAVLQNLDIVANFNETNGSQKGAIGVLNNAISDLNGKIAAQIKGQETTGIYTNHSTINILGDSLINIKNTGDNGVGIRSYSSNINTFEKASVSIQNDGENCRGVQAYGGFININKDVNLHIENSDFGLWSSSGAQINVGGNIYLKTKSCAIRTDSTGNASTLNITSTAQIYINNSTNNYFINGAGNNILDVAIRAKLAFEKDGKTEWYEVKDDWQDENTSPSTNNTITADNVKNKLNVEETSAWTLPEKAEMDFIASNSNSETTKQDFGDNSKQYQEIINQYDALIKDAGYKGINLLQTDKLTVKFNEESTAALEVQGRDMSSKALGFTTFEWESQGDINKSIEELSSAINTIRNYSSELGNNYNIITTRQDFTESLINVLTEGADKLTLADMNEESANMLALQTRQQLAINSLSLASQASQSILKLF